MYSISKRLMDTVNESDFSDSDDDRFMTMMLGRRTFRECFPTLPHYPKMDIHFILFEHEHVIDFDEYDYSGTVFLLFCTQGKITANGRMLFEGEAMLVRGIPEDLEDASKNGISRYGYTIVDDERFVTLQ